MPVSERPRCSVFVAVSLDGCIARADGGIDWLESVEVPGEDYGIAAFYASVDALVLGRNSYDKALSFPEWPYAGMRCVVLTHRPLAPRHGETAYGGPLEPLFERLAREGVRHVYLDGGNAIQQGLAAGLVDELTVSILPHVLGGGIRLFALEGPEIAMRLEASRSWPSGLVQLRYQITEGP